MKILFADDNEMIRRLTSFVLEQRGHSVKTVTDGDEVIEFLNVLPSPDMVITDFNMPRMDGLEVLRYIRADDRFKLLRVIVYTTNDSVGFKSDIKALGGVLVNKIPNELIAAVDTVVNEIAKE